MTSLGISSYNEIQSGLESGSFAVEDGCLMGRPKKFEREILIEKAMKVFWAKGYEATSISDLAEAMGILSGSLYNMFGDKKSLFLESLELYEATAQRMFLSVLEEPGSRTEAIDRLFRKVATFLGEDATRRGCLLSNTMLECNQPGDASLQIAERHRLAMEKAFVSALAQAQATGEMSPRSQSETRVLAQTLVNALQGLRLTSRTVHDVKALQKIARASLAILN
jgi:TetR/AcrR family transcriptional repressor of nem operon